MHLAHRPPEGRRARLEVSERATSVIENTSPATVIMEPATVVSRPQAPAATAPKSSGQRAARCRSTLVSRVIRRSASTTASTTIRAGTNQKLERIDCQPWRGFVFMLGDSSVIRLVRASAYSSLVRIPSPYVCADRPVWARSLGRRAARRHVPGHRRQVSVVESHSTASVTEAVVAVGSVAKKENASAMYVGEQTANNRARILPLKRRKITFRARVMAPLIDRTDT